MKIVLFYHSLASDWNHGNAHFLRGIINELINRGHSVMAYEPDGGWSLSNLIADHGEAKAKEYKKYYPMLDAAFYNPEKPEYEKMLKNADLVIVHEWNKPELIAEIGRFKKQFKYKLLFHDTHHRAVSDVKSMAAYDFTSYDGALVFGRVIKEIYKSKGWISKVWTWHEAADVTVFKPLESEKEGDLVWIGNWGDDERKDELAEFLIKPVKQLGLKAKIYGVRYPPHALEALKDAGISYGGYLPNYKVPEVFAKYKVTIHVPRGPYVKLLPGIQTIRPFEALACGIPMISTLWQDTENLFTSGKDFLTAKHGEEMKSHLTSILNDESLASSLASHGRNTILNGHTCAHRVNELETILIELGMEESMIHPLQKNTLA